MLTRFSIRWKVLLSSFLVLVLSVLLITVFISIASKRNMEGELRAFREAYRAALDTWREGMRTVIFPAETWLMRVLHKVEVATG